MKHGKQVCKILKEIRQQIAEKNDIELFISECHFQGECKGTCPKCEAEVRYLEQELNQRRQLGKAVAVAGISMGMAGAFASCGIFTQKNMQTSESVVSVDMLEIPDSLANRIKPPLIEDSIDRKNLSDDSVIIMGFMIENKRIIENKRLTDETDENAIYQFVEVSPEFPGGEEELRRFIKENFVYPKDAKENGIEGTVYVGFVVEKDGNLSNINVERGINKDCDEEALRITKMMPKWKPGRQGGKNTDMKFTIPVKFQLPKNETRKKSL